MHVAANALDVAVSDSRAPDHGALAAARGALLREPPSDPVLAERIRARLGRAAVHARAFDVICDEGHIELRGDALEEEAAAVLSLVRGTPGVRGVVDHLTRHATADVPQLQGLPRARRSRRTRWRPATRLVVGAAGALAAVQAVRDRGPRGAALIVAGGMAVARSVTNRSLLELLGAGGPEVTTLRRSLVLHAPIHRVFATWLDVEAYPRFMAHVGDVRRHDADRFYCRVVGPAGPPIDWEVAIVERAPDARVRFAARSSFAQVDGDVGFEARPDGTTRVVIELAYTPRLGGVGRSISSLFRAGAKHEIDEDLLRLKSLVERGKARGRGGVVTLSAVRGGDGSGDGARR